MEAVPAQHHRFDFPGTCGAGSASGSTVRGKQSLPEANRACLFLPNSAEDH